jgi:glycosyltransferase involved in cell wall biosynthesis
MFPASGNEYVKSVSRWILKQDGLQSKNYLWKGHSNSIRYILDNAALLLPNSQQEYEQLKDQYHFDKAFYIIPNGINEKLFQPDESSLKQANLVLCAARIEGIKNQLNLIKALNDTEFKLLLIGDPSPNQVKYYEQCRKIAKRNIEFIARLSQEKLITYYKKAKVHILPSWFETCGLSSLEAAAMGCNIVITNKGFAGEYFGYDAVYCDPGSRESIYNAVKQAAMSPSQKKLQEKILANFTWRHAAIKTMEAYKDVI